MRILELKKFRKHRDGGSYFDDLPWPAQQAARSWLWRFRQRWRRNLPAWRFAILVGQARRLAMNPPSSAWGRTMRAKLGGYAVQRRYRAEGRHPTEIATAARKWQQSFGRSRPRIVHLPTA